MSGTAAASRLTITGWLRLAMAATLCVFGCLFVGGAWYDWNRVVENAGQVAGSTAEMLREHALKVLETDELLIQHMDWIVQGQSWEQIRANRAALEAEAQVMIARYPQFSALSLADDQGLEWITAASNEPSPPQSGLNEGSRAPGRPQRDADQGTLITRARADLSATRNDFAVSHRRVNLDGSFGGTVRIAIDSAYFTAFWAKAVRGVDAAAGNTVGGAKVALMQPDGTIVARYPATGGDMEQTDNAPLLSPNRAAPEATIVYRKVSATDGAERIYGGAKVGTFPLYISYGIPMRALRAAWLHRVTGLASLCLVAAAALIGTLIFAAHQAEHLMEERARRTEAEEQALEGQRLEVLGQLAAGVAHDFANVMQVVEGSAVTIQRKLPDDRVRRLTDRIIEAARQGRSLTSRMMDFARGSGETPLGLASLVDPAEAVTAVVSLMSSTLGRGYQIESRVETKGLPQLVQGDRSGLQGAIMNLAINARDAMPNGGRILICVAPVEKMPHAPPACPGQCPPEMLKAGLYAQISVIDSGSGMTPDVLARAGQAFFTTKPRGRGTGLGLAGARGFAVRHGGGLHIESVEGRGTTVSLWLPDKTRAALDLRPEPATQASTTAA